MIKIIELSTPGPSDLRDPREPKYSIKSVCGTTDKLELLLRGGDVLRYHMEGKQLAPQNNAEHTWRVLTILLHLWPDVSREMIIAAHYHDVAECYTGDPSVMVKGRFKEFMTVLESDFHQHVCVPHELDLSNEDLARLKVADYLEALITARWQTTPNARAVAERAEEILVLCIEALPETERDAVWALVERITGKLHVYQISGTRGASE